MADKKSKKAPPPQVTSSKQPPIPPKTKLSKDKVDVPTTASIAHKESIMDEDISEKEMLRMILAKVKKT